MVRGPKLIVLRGPSGSGKSTVAKIIFKEAQHKTVLIEQDYYRFIFNPPGGDMKPNTGTIHRLILHNTLEALKDGYDVILEGILSVKSYNGILEEIFRQHPQDNYIFYFDISLEETIRRHTTRPDKTLMFGEEEMRKWYPRAHKSNHELEQIIPEQYSVKETVKYIKQTAGL
ncbi:TPA: hypothetical protein DD449_04655 [Candidatus Berkelbacteria bacterium]|uniref:UDP-N-acetylglucosamine kinase n=1 Tax=Berkelbacteria bacterium GW2011_GWE1_39_12 TaxID=1618337 RepID=A0A0G4B3D8_9BACT|nr:MAG: hypothetical protein UT28_C0001G0550 [Berkelbacteria bacterium GW2011_GWE1_39_12]HBO60945.1 hypothetical protein [Candidatus Berkelbacteria bacterium]